MAAVASPSDQAAGLLETLSLNSVTETPEAAKNGIYSENGVVIYPQGYGYAPFGTCPSQNSHVPVMSHDGQLYGTHYHYPGQFYQPAASPSMLYSPSISNAAQRDAPSLATDRGPFFSGNANNVGRAGVLYKSNTAKPIKTSNQNLSSNAGGSYKRGVSPTVYPTSGYQDLRFGYDGYQSPVQWLDASLLSSAPSSTSGSFSPANSHLSRLPSGIGQASGFMNLMYPKNRMYSHYGNGASSTYGSYGYNSWTNSPRWSVVPNKYKSRGGASGTESSDCLNELNRGPRANGVKNQTEHASITPKPGQTMPLENNKEDNLSQMPEDKYSGKDVREDYSDSKFFVIKSYSEDDIHKSIKYGVWSSTPNGNQKLDAAYRKAKENGSDCPVFLLFSVNTSGQFVGLVEMVGPVDFNKTVDCWQQEKWIGCFPVKWHIIKDVPNSLLRHIALENNENKPVTNSRDTQEVAFEKGMQILKIFKEHKGKTSVLDDFGFYEVRERIMVEKRAKLKIQKQPLDVKPSSYVTGAGERVATINAGKLISEPAHAATAEGLVKTLEA